MTITLPDELAERLQNRARENGLSVEALLEDLLDEEWDGIEGPEDREDETELAEIRRAIDESMDEFDRGASHSAEAVFADLSRRYDLPD